MQINKYFLGVAPGALAALLAVTSSSYASDTQDQEPQTNLSSSSQTIEELEKILEEEERLNQEIHSQLIEAQEQAKREEEKKKAELIKRIEATRVAREKLLEGNFTFSQVSQSSKTPSPGSLISEQQPSEVLRPVSSSGATDGLEEQDSGGTVPSALPDQYELGSSSNLPPLYSSQFPDSGDLNEEAKIEEDPQTHTANSKFPLEGTEEFEKEKQKVIETSNLAYEILLGEKIGRELQNHFGQYTSPGLRKKHGLAWEGFMKTLPLIAKYCTGKLPWRGAGEEWYKALTDHAYEMGSPVKHKNANGSFNGQRPGRKQDTFDTLQLVIDCWKSTQGFESAGIQQYALGLDAKTLVGQTKEEYIEAAVEGWKNGKFSLPSNPAQIPGENEEPIAASSSSAPITVQSEGSSTYLVIDKDDVKRLKKNVVNETKKLGQKLLGK